MKICEDCEGTGLIDYFCPYCSGSGEGMADGARCQFCKGKGERKGECKTCYGSGDVDEADSQ